MMTIEEIVWRWLKTTPAQRTSAVCRMLDDGRLKLGGQLQLEPMEWWPGKRDKPSEASDANVIACPAVEANP